MDIRDDRLNLFTSVSGKAKTFYYMVRAVSPGVYKLGPVQAVPCKMVCSTLTMAPALSKLKYK